MFASRPVLVLIAGATFVAATIDRSSGQDGVPPAPMPDVPGVAARVAGPPPWSGLPPAPRATTCTPDHCLHRGQLARRRCKRHLQEVFIGYPEEFERPPLGGRLYEANRAQVSNGEMSGMVLRNYDFVPGTTQLNLRGRDRLAMISGGMAKTFYPIVIERTPDTPGLDVRRRGAVLAALSGAPFPVPPQRVIIGPSIGFGLAGEEAELIYQGQLQRASQAGPPLLNAVSGSPTSGGGFR
jgi:hypothetical protein